MLAPEDVATIPATVTPSKDDTTGKYPEYHRIWEDSSFDFVAVFGVENAVSATDAGANAFDDFVRRAGSYLASLQSVETKRATTRTVAEGRRRAHLEAILPDDRAVHVDAILVGQRLDGEGSSFDAWYDTLSAKADVILYSGHAAHGANVHTLMTKGTFEARKYLVWIANGCDTLAYLDRTLAERRAQLNPDDAPGTKYLDVISNARSPWFRTGDETSMRFFRDIVAASGESPAPKTYREIFSGIDRDQVIVVTGEDDNEFPVSSSPSAGPPKAPPSGPSGNEGAPAQRRPSEPETNDSSGGGCDLAAHRTDGWASVLFLVGLGLAIGFARASSSDVGGSGSGAIRASKSSTA